MNPNIIKIFLALLLFACLLNMPYGFYQMVRFLMLGGMVYLFFVEDKAENKIIYIILALLFQPLIKIPLGRTIWNIVDVVVGVGLIIDTFKNSKK
ncbi:MAG: hypothetical protein Q4A00_06605 [Flavobacteriaceae bacterium]|nr:hypothetical protein [Flavobacteriaceae bacterium]